MIGDAGSSGTRFYTGGDCGHEVRVDVKLADLLIDPAKQ